MNIAVIGGGISGLSIANMLLNNHNVVVYEKENRPGGLIKCDVVDGNLFHRTGGHVFNSKRSDALSFFWSFFDKDRDFLRAFRHSSVFMDDGTRVDYPIENHVYQLGPKILDNFIDELIKITKNEGNFKSTNFEEFLKYKFGQTLYDIYFRPYNFKIWRTNLTNIPLSWLEGKLPMPSVKEMIFNNIMRIEEQKFVHSSFYYPKKHGSQFIADKFAEKLDIRYDSFIEEIQYSDNLWQINDMKYDAIIYTGNIKQLPSLLRNTGIIQNLNKSISDLKYHGTTTVFCEIDRNDYSWIYLPSQDYEAHRIICTGNFSPENNKDGLMTGTIEFTDFIGEDEIIKNLKKLPIKTKYLTHNYEKYTYPIQNKDTRGLIDNTKALLRPFNFHLLGRFAEWEYYNMDVAIGAAIDLCKNLQSNQN